MQVVQQIQETRIWANWLLETFAIINKMAQFMPMCVLFGWNTHLGILNETSSDV